MSKKKKHKKSDENFTLKLIVLITAILNLIEVLMEIIKVLIE